MAIKLSDYVGKRVMATQRDGSVLGGMLTDDGPSPYVYNLQERQFCDNGHWDLCDITDADIVAISLLEPHQNTMKDLLDLLATLTDPHVQKPPFHIRKKDDGDFALSIVEDIESDFGSRWQVIDTVVFSADGEVTAKGSTTLYDALRHTKRAKALAKLTAEDREVLGL